jgi:hypothetical protein
MLVALACHDVSSRVGPACCRWDKVNSAMVSHLDEDKDGKITTAVRPWDPCLLYAPTDDCSVHKPSLCARLTPSYHHHHPPPPTHIRTYPVPQDLRAKWDRLLHFLGYGMPSGTAPCCCCNVGWWLIIRPPTPQPLLLCPAFRVIVCCATGAAFATCFVVGLTL